MYPCGFVVAESQRVPDCTRTIVPPSGAPVVGALPRISYQRAPLRPPVELAVQPVLTWMLCAAHSVLDPVSLFLWIEALKTRSSDVSMLVVEPEAGWRIGKVVVGTVRLRLAERVGVPPGV